MITKPNAFVFYFTFVAVDERPDVTYGFVVPDAAAVFEKFFATNFEDMVEKIYDLGTVDKIESAFGVHDWSTSPSLEVDAVGFSTYEVEPDQISTVMELWREAFTANVAPGPVVKLPVTVALGSDYAAYKFITRTYKKG